MALFDWRSPARKKAEAIDRKKQEKKEKKETARLEIYAKAYNKEWDRRFRIIYLAWRKAGHTTGDGLGGFSTKIMPDNWKPPKKRK